jgi:hypothetical protein
MRRAWVVVLGLVGVVLATGARADTVFLTDGQTIWGREVLEEGDSVVIVRPGGDLRIPKSQVSRIERMQSTLPPFYTPPGTPSEGDRSSGGRTASGVGAPSAPGPAGGPAPQATPPPSGGTTQLPPPPPPPPTR